MNYEKWLVNAVDKINDLPKGTTFEVKELFLGTDWEKLSRGEKTSFGRYFASKVKEGNLKDVVKIGEGKTHHNRYIKQY